MVTVRRRTVSRAARPAHRQAGGRELPLLAQLRRWAVPCYTRDKGKLSRHLPLGRQLSAKSGSTRGAAFGKEIAGVSPLALQGGSAIHFG